MCQEGRRRRRAQALAHTWEKPLPLAMRRLLLLSPRSFSAIALVVSRPQRLAAELVRGRSAGAYYDPMMDHYMDTTQLQNWAKERAAEGGGAKQKVPPAVWKKLKEEKQAKKQAAAKAWLRD